MEVQWCICFIGATCPIWPLLGALAQVTKAANGGDWDNLVTRDEETGRAPIADLENSEVRKLIRMLVKEMEAMENAGILHLDVKLKNLVYHKDGSGVVTGVSLIDFAEGRYVTGDDFVVVMPVMDDGVQLYHRTPALSELIDPDDWGFT
ncbi:hypothetical protein CYMTET_53313, partial [Cymbomonas tetramitiformis]